MKKWLYLLIIIGLLVLLSACANGEKSEVETAALAFVEAALVNEGEFLTDNICANVPAGSTSLDVYSLFTIGMAMRDSLTFTLEDIEIDLEAATEREEGNETFVHIQGSVTYPQGLVASEMAPLPRDETTTFDEVWRMRQEDGIWKWCGGTENGN